jgi:hypothetical protein
MVPRGRGAGIGAYDKQATVRKQSQALAHQVAQPAADPVAYDRPTDDSADHEPHSGRGRPLGLTRVTRDTGDVVRDEVMDHQAGPGTTPPAAHHQGEVGTLPHSIAGGQHAYERRVASDGQLGAALAAAPGQDRPARAGPHAQPEAVRLGAAAVVRLEGTLAHFGLQCCGRDADRSTDQYRGIGVWVGTGARVTGRRTSRQDPGARDPCDGRRCGSTVVRYGPGAR